VFVAGKSNDSNHTSSTAAAVERGSITAGDPIPAPDGKAVLRVTGVDSGNAGTHTTAIGFRTLEQMPRVTLSVYEPFLKRDVTFSGVRMSDLLAVIGVSPSDSSIYMHALDDYHVTFTRDQLASSGAVLATRAGGERIAIKDGGPIRIIHSRSGRVADNGDNWIWSVDRMKASR
jgi:hypothetical protein